MSHSILAHFDGKVIVPDEPLDLPVGQRLKIGLEPIVAIAEKPASLLEDAAAITELPNVLEKHGDGGIVVRGHRISLHLILEFIHSGLNAKEIQQRLPSIPPPDLDEIIDWCRRNEELMNRYLEFQQIIVQATCDDDHRGPALDELRSRRIRNGAAGNP